MSYEVWFDNGKGFWVGYHSFKHKLKAQMWMEQFQKAIRKVRQVQRMRKQRGYAFSQTDESQRRVLEAYDTTKERGRYGELREASSNQMGMR